MKQKSKQLLQKVFSFIKRRWKLVLILIIILIGGFLWYQRRQKSNQPDLTFQQPIRKDLTKTVEVSGVIDAGEKARLRFLAGGKVTYLGAWEGDLVEKGQTIATIDQATLKKQLEQDLNTFMKERLDWDQTNDDVFEDVYTTTEERIREKAQLDLTNEVLDVEIRDIAIANTRLTAPFQGILTASPTDVTGVQLLSTDVFEIINPDTLVFKALVDEVDIGLIKKNQMAEIELDAHPEKTFTSVVNYISYSSSESSSGTVFIVELPIDIIQYGIDRFRLGMNGDVNIEVETQPNVMVIPLEATRERDNTTYVDVRTGEYTYEERAIEVGLETDDEVEIISGLSLEDEILIPE